MTPAPDTGRTAEEKELREALETELALVIHGGGMISPRAFASLLIAGPLAKLITQRDEVRGYANRNGNAARYWEWIHDEKDKRLARAEAEAAHLRAENANLRDRVREAEGAGRDPDGSGSRPSDQAASHPAPAGFDPSRGFAEIAAKQAILGQGLVDITIIRHEGKAGVLFIPRADHIEFGAGGRVQAGDYWPTANDIVLWVEGEGPGVAISYLSQLAPPQGMEALVAETEGLGAKPDSPVAEGDAPTPLPDSRSENTGGRGAP